MLSGNSVDVKDEAVSANNNANFGHCCSLQLSKLLIPKLKRKLKIITDVFF